MKQDFQINTANTPTFSIGASEKQKSFWYDYMTTPSAEKGNRSKRKKRNSKDKHK
jgi:hypothetical protein